MSAIKKILVAVKNPDARRQPGVDKAIGIARSLGASVELFNAISTPIFLELEPLTGRTVTEIKREALELRGKRLEKIAARARKRGVKTTCSVEWDFPPHEAIVRRARHSGVDLIIAECHQGRRLKPWLIHLTDWELLRVSPLPVLLLKNARPWRQPTILAAIDPTHTHDKPARLDTAIVAEATRLARALDGSVELIHAMFPTAFAIAVGDPAINAMTLAAVYEQQKQRSRAMFDAFADKARIPRASRQLVDSEPEFAIPHVAKKLGADLVVMGAVSRSGLKRVFIGNTAERVLDDLPCDVLVVKPARPATLVEGRARGARLVPMQPLAPMPC
ncbi:MAG TPA: universal stress protein [Steroidobacteraceae bacterium]|nr:universal stress protein [Steroidobacteraceae bacterium]